MGDSRITNSSNGLGSTGNLHQPPRVVGMSRKTSAVEETVGLLHAAIHERDVNKVKELLASGVDPNQPDWQRNAEIPLLEAAETEDMNLLKAMIDGGCDPNVRDWHGETALHVLTRLRKPQVALLKLFVEAGADGSIADNLSGCTPLHHVLKHFTPSKTKAELDDLRLCVECLLKISDPNKTTKRNTTPLHIVVSAGIDDQEPLRSLLSAGANPNVFDDEGLSPLLQATERDCPGLVKVLLEFGALPSQTNRYNETPLHVAARRNSVAVAKELLRGADAVDFVNAVDLDGNTALLLAAGRGFREMVILILQEPSVDINAMNFNGYTALHNAVESGFTEVVSLLVEVKECDLRRLTRRRLSALDLAKEGSRKYSSPAVCEVLHRALESSLTLDSDQNSLGNTSIEEEVLPVSALDPGKHIGDGASTAWRL